MEELANQLRSLGHTVEILASHQIVVVKGYRIYIGKHAGVVVDIGIPNGQMFPNAPPAGIHVSQRLEPSGQRNISDSPLGGTWQYWSRQLADWAGTNRSAKHIISYVNRVLNDA